MLKIAIVGQDTLARATEDCCLQHFVRCSGPALHAADLLWVCYDTPIGSDDCPDVEWVLAKIRADLQHIPSSTLVLVSSQLPVGTTARLEQEYPTYTFAYSPENIRVATAAQDFTTQARVVVGRRSDRHDDLFRELFAPFTGRLILTDPETAEMAKHALNSYLGLCIAFINEIARLSAVVGADAAVVSETLRAEPRVSALAPLRPGPPFGGGHLARDIVTLTTMGTHHGVSMPIIAHIKDSNR